MANSRYDVVVVGAGPAGLAAAAAASFSGCDVLLMDSAEQPGGQYWRHPHGRLDAVADLQHDLRTFRCLLSVIRSRVTYLARHDVWTVVRGGRGFEAHAVAEDSAVVVSGSALVLAPGGYDRQIPFPGWDRPGVFSAGGAQALLKGHQVTAGQRAAVGGTGPFLLPVAAGLAARGVTVVGVFEANSTLGWMRHLPSVVRTPDKIAEGVRFAAALAHRRVGFHARHAIVEAHGEGQVRSVTVAKLDGDWRALPGSRRTIACDAVAVGWGFVPRLELPLALGCATHVDADGSLVASVDERQATTVPGVFVAGEAGGVGGAALALVEGDIAGRAAAAWVGRPVTWPAGLRRRRRTYRAFATAMHRAHPVRDGWRGWIGPDTVVCRCEEVTASAVVDAVRRLGATDARTVKLLCRAGMGWCQGRICGYATGLLTTAETGRPSDPAGLAERPVATPMSLRTLADGADR